MDAIPFQLQLNFQPRHDLQEQKKCLQLYLWEVKNAAHAYVAGMEQLLIFCLQEVSSLTDHYTRILWLGIEAVWPSG